MSDLSLSDPYDNGWLKYGTLTFRHMDGDYIRVRVVGHPIFGTGVIREHRLVMIEKVGRRLDRNELVHHKREKTCNHPDELELMSNGEHTTHHMTGHKLSAEGRKKLSDFRKKLWKSDEYRKFMATVDRRGGRGQGR